MAIPNIYDNLYNAVPGIDQEAERQRQAAAQVQLRGQLAKLSATPGVSAARVGQALAPTVVQQGSESAVQSLAKTQQTTAQQAQQALATQQRQAETGLARSQISAEEQQKTAEQQQFEQLANEQQDTKRRITTADIAAERTLAQHGLTLDNNMFFLTDQQQRDLSAINENLTKQIFDSRMIWDKDELGRKFANENQLLDFAVLSAKSQDELMNKAQQIEQASQQELALMEFAQKMQKDILQRGYIREKGDLDFQTEKQFKEDVANWDKMLQEKRDKDQLQREQLSAWVNVSVNAIKAFV